MYVILFEEKKMDSGFNLIITLFIEQTVPIDAYGKQKLCYPMHGDRLIMYWAYMCSSVEYVFICVLIYGILSRL